MNQEDLRYLRLLSQTFPTVASASTEIINLQAILHLPKGTEHFLADLHGEHQAFGHVLRNASGTVKRKVNDIFGTTLREQEKRELCSLIYYPEEKLEIIKASEQHLTDWYRITLHRLVAICRDVSSKYTRSKVRKALPEEFRYIIQELLHERPDDRDKADYINVIVDTIISTRRADDFIIAISYVIQRLAIDRLHILGDIYDRGPGAHIIMETLAQRHSWDIQWGNHDVLWMGASAGNRACICNVIRLSLRYANMSTLEDGYGINLLPLATFAMDTYGDDACEEFVPHFSGGAAPIDAKAQRLTALMHKAITVLQLKEEARIYRRRPLWAMQGRMMLDRIDYSRGTVQLEDGCHYPLRSCHFPTVDTANPSALTPAEETLMERLTHSFTHSQRLRRDIELLLAHGCMYAVYNHNLLFHAAIPLRDDGTMMPVEIYPGRVCEGRELMRQTGLMIRAAFESDTPQDYREYARDYFLYLWCGPQSPLFCKSKMATFERYFIADATTHREEKGAYFRLRDNAATVERILDAFGVEGDCRHIINGHVPVHAASGESPVKAGGRLMVIDGGFSQAYHAETGIAGYTLVYHSRGFQLVQHEPFTSTRDAIERGTDIRSTTQIVEITGHRMLVADTDKGAELQGQIRDLRALLHAYRHGYITER